MIDCRRIRSPLVALALALGGPLAAASIRSPREGGAPPEAVPTVWLESARGELESRPLAGFATSDPRELGAVFVRFEGLAPPEPSSSASRELPEARIELAGGDLWVGRVPGGKGENLEVILAGVSRVALPIEDLASLVFPGHVPEGEAAALVPAEEGDRLFWNRGSRLDRIDGTVEEFTFEGVRFDSVLGSRVFAWEEVAALYVDAFETSSSAPSASDSPPAVLDLRDGSRIRGHLLGIEENVVRLALRGTLELEVEPAAVAEVWIDDGSVAFLSDLPAIEERAGSPFDDDLGMQWPHRVDRSVTGSPLVAGGRAYLRGLGVHAPSRLVYRIEGDWKFLRGQVAIDDQVLRLSSHGSVVFRVLVAGEVRWESERVRGGEAPLAMPLVPIDPGDLGEGGTEIVLEVDMLDDYHVADRADWLRVLLIRGD